LDNYLTKFYQTWIIESAEAPLVLHAIMFAASHHNETILKTYGVDKTLPEQLHHKGHPLKLVRQLVAHPAKGYILDDLVMAILYLAVNERAPAPVSFNEPSPFIPPLKNAQLLHMYTVREFDFSYWRAIQSHPSTAWRHRRIDKVRPSLASLLVRTPI
jgi:hypothetical protein